MVLVKWNVTHLSECIDCDGVQGWCEGIRYSMSYCSLKLLRSHKTVHISCSNQKGPWLQVSSFGHNRHLMKIQLVLLRICYLFHKHFGIVLMVCASRWERLVGS